MPTTSSLSDPICVACDGKRFLLAERADIEAGDYNGRAQIHDLEVKPPSYSEVMKLQVFFKWAEWDEATEADYLEALKEARE